MIHAHKRTSLKKYSNTNSNPMSKFSLYHDNELVSALGLLGLVLFYVFPQQKMEYKN